MSPCGNDSSSHWIWGEVQVFKSKSSLLNHHSITDPDTFWVRMLVQKKVLLDSEILRMSCLLVLNLLKNPYFCFSAKRRPCWWQCSETKRMVGEDFLYVLYPPFEASLCPNLSLQQHKHVVTFPWGKKRLDKELRHTATAPFHPPSPPHQSLSPLDLRSSGHHITRLSIIPLSRLHLPSSHPSLVLEC